MVLSKVCEKRENGAKYLYINLNKIQRFNEGVSQDKESLSRETHKNSL